jgi:transcriptional regulator with XRE-family HTH domain
MRNSQARSEPDTEAAADSFASAMQFWRRARRMSQLELSLEAGVSARHISFLESGRAKPSREMVLTLCEALLLPRAVRNGLLKAAGFTSAFPETALGLAALEPLEQALQEMLANHAPWPALVCDRHWNIIQTNPAASLLLASLQTDGPANIITMICDSPAASDLIVNLDEIRWELLARIRLEALEAGRDPQLAALEARLRDVLEGSKPSESARRPLVPVKVRAFGVELAFLTAIAHFGTSEDVVVRDLRVELMFPADQQSRDVLEALASGALKAGS